MIDDSTTKNTRLLDSEFKTEHLEMQFFVHQINVIHVIWLHYGMVWCLTWQTHAIITALFLPGRRYASAGNSDRNVSVCPCICLHDFFIW